MFLRRQTSRSEADVRRRGGLHIESKKLKNGLTIYWGHNDTVSYYIGQRGNAATFSLWKWLVHGGVDVIGGNLGNYIFP